MCHERRITGSMSQASSSSVTATASIANTALWLAFLIGGSARAQSSQSPKTAEPENWKIHSIQSLIDDSTTVTVSTMALETITGWPDKQIRPSLIIRYQEGKFDAYVSTGMSAHVEGGFGDDLKTCTVRFDKRKATTIGLSESTSHEALFFAGARNWINRMLESERMVFRFIPFNSTPQTCVFDLRGIRDALRPIEEASGWRIGSLADKLGRSLSHHAAVPSAVGHATREDVSNHDLNIGLTAKSALEEYAPLRDLALDSILDALVLDLARSGSRKT